MNFPQVPFSFFDYCDMCIFAWPSDKDECKSNVYNINMKQSLEKPIRLFKQEITKSLFRLVAHKSLGNHTRNNQSVSIFTKTIAAFEDISKAIAYR